MIQSAPASALGITSALLSFAQQHPVGPQPASAWLTFLSALAIAVGFWTLVAWQVVGVLPLGKVYAGWKGKRFILTNAGGKSKNSSSGVSGGAPCGVSGSSGIELQPTQQGRRGNCAVSERSGNVNLLGHCHQASLLPKLPDPHRRTNRDLHFVVLHNGITSILAFLCFLMVTIVGENRSEPDSSDWVKRMAIWLFANEIAYEVVDSAVFLLRCGSMDLGTTVHHIGAPLCIALSLNTGMNAQILFLLLICIDLSGFCVSVGKLVMRRNRDLSRNTSTSGAGKQEKRECNMKDNYDNLGGPGHNPQSAPNRVVNSEESESLSRLLNTIMIDPLVNLMNTRAVPFCERTFGRNRMAFYDPEREFGSPSISPSVSPTDEANGAANSNGNSTANSTADGIANKSSISGIYNTEESNTGQSSNRTLNSRDTLSEQQAYFETVTYTVLLAMYVPLRIVGPYLATFFILLELLAHSGWRSEQHHDPLMHFEHFHNAGLSGAVGAWWSGNIGGNNDSGGSESTKSTRASSASSGLNDGDNSADNHDNHDSNRPNTAIHTLRPWVQLYVTAILSQNVLNLYFCWLIKRKSLMSGRGWCGGRKVKER